MKRFRTRDLMIQAIPEQLGWPMPGCWCTRYTSGPHCEVDYLLNHLDQVIQHGEPAELAILKAQLQQLHAEVRRQEQVLIERERPQTVAEVDMLEGRLNTALEELQVRRKELEAVKSKKTKKSK